MTPSLRGSGKAHSQQGMSRPLHPRGRSGVCAHSATTPVRPITTRRGDRSAFAGKSQAEREARLVEEQTQLDTLIEGANSHTEPYRPQPTLWRERSSDHASHWNCGWFAAHELMDEVIDRDHSIDPNLRTGVEGGAAGVMTEGAAALAGTALTAGGAGRPGLLHLAAKGTHDREIPLDQPRCARGPEGSVSRHGCRRGRVVWLPRPPSVGRH